MKLGSRIGCIALYAFVTVSGLFVGVLVVRDSLMTRASNGAFATSGVTILGTVTDHVFRSGDIRRREKDTFFLVASYQVAGLSYSVQSDFSITRIESHPLGSSVQVRYLPSDPANARIVGFAEERWLVPALFGSGVLFVSSCALALALWLGLRTRRTGGPT